MTGDQILKVYLLEENTKEIKYYLSDDPNEEIKFLKKKLISGMMPFQE